MNILIVQTAFLGDVVLTTPVINSAKILFPNSNIFVLTTPAGAKFIEDDKDIKVLTYDKNKKRGLKEFLNQVKILKNEKIDIAFALQKSFRTSLLLFLSNIKKRVGFLDAGFSFLYTTKIKPSMKKHAVIRNLEILSKEEGFDKARTELKLYLKDKKELGEDFVKEVDDLKDFVLLCPGSAWKTKRWKKEEYKNLAKELLKQGKKVALCGGEKEKDIADFIAEGIDVKNFVGKLKIPQTLYLVSKAKCVVCNDSMLLHVASAFKIPTVVVFCATSPEFGFGPWENEKAFIVQKENLPCKPCMHHGGNKCPKGHEECRLISYQEVLRAISAINEKK